MQLNLLEKFILLAHHPEKARFYISDIQIRYGIVGAMLLDLSSRDKIDIRNNKLYVKDIHGIENPLSAELGRYIIESGKSKKIKYWIGKQGRNGGKYQQKIIRDLATKNILTVEEKKALWLFPYLKSKVSNKVIRQKLVSQTLRNALNPSELTSEQLMLLGLTEACKMHHAISKDKREIQKIKSNLKETLRDSPIAATIDQTIKEVQTAVVMAIIASTAATTTTTTLTSS